MYNLQRHLGEAAFKGRRARLMMYRQMARFSERGYDVKVPLEVMHERALKKRRAIALVYAELLHGISAGRRFSDLLEPYVPNAERIAISSGEDAGKVGQGLRMAAYVAESSMQLRNALIQGLAYPTMLLGMFIALLIFVAWFLMPEVEAMYPVELWPTSSAALHWISNGIKSYGIYLAIVAGSIGAVSIVTLPQWTSEIRYRLDHVLPPWTIYREIQAGQLLVSVSGVVAAGTPLDDALRRIRGKASKWLVVHVDEIVRRIAEGKRPAHAMDTGLMGETLTDELLAYDRAGDLAGAIEHLGRDAVELVIQRIRSFSAAIGVVLMFGVGAGLIWTWSAFVMVFMAMRSSSGFA